MKRNLKALGLAILTVFAMSALLAQAAQANSFDTIRTFPTGSHAFVHAEADLVEPRQTFTAGGFSIHCAGVSTTEKGGFGNATITDRSTALTGEPHYTLCENSLGGGATVRANECTYTFESETDMTEHAHMQETCSLLKAIEIETAGCIISIGAQRLSGYHYTNIETGGGAERDMRITLSATVERSMTFHTNKAFACSLAGIPSEGHEASYTGKLTVRGSEDNGGVEGFNQVGITIENLATEEMP